MSCATPPHNNVHYAQVPVANSLNIDRMFSMAVDVVNLINDRGLAGDLCSVDQTNDVGELTGFVKI
jgi:hypothetical protein